LEKEFFKELKKEHPEVQIEQYEVITSEENQKILKGFF